MINSNFENCEKLVLTQKPTQMFGLKFRMQGLTYFNQFFDWFLMKILLNNIYAQFYTFLFILVHQMEMAVNHCSTSQLIKFPNGVVASAVKHDFRESFVNHFFLSHQHLGREWQFNFSRYYYLQGVSRTWIFEVGWLFLCRFWPLSNWASF